LSKRKLVLLLLLPGLLFLWIVGWSLCVAGARKEHGLLCEICEEGVVFG
jgi:hypothetical protein